MNAVRCLVLRIASGSMLAVMFGCGARSVPHTGPAASDQTLARADRLASEGCYTCLREAVTAYAARLDEPETEDAVISRAFEAAVLLLLRARELGFSEGPAWAVVTAALPRKPSMDRSIVLDIVRAVPHRLASLGTDGRRPSPEAEVLRRWRQRFDQRAAATPFEAYIALTLACRFRDSGDGPALARPAVGSDAPSLPPSPLLQYRSATCGNADADGLMRLLRDHPRFQEAHLLLGQDFAATNRYAGAERHLLLARVAFPDQPTPNAALGGLLASLEAHGEAVPVFRDALRLAPAHPGLLMGLVRSLSFSGLPKEALTAINELAATNSRAAWELHYWRAWNYERLEDLARAEHEAARARGLLSSFDVFKLSLTIASQRGDHAAAKAWFLQALDHTDQDCEVWLLGAQSHEKLEALGAAADAYQRSARCFVDLAQAFREQVAALASIDIEPARRATLEDHAAARIAAAERARALSELNAGISLTRLNRATEGRSWLLSAAKHPETAARALGWLDRR